MINPEETNLHILLATKISTPIIGQLASLMGYIMDGIYRVLNGLFGIQNLGLCIIIFSIIIYLLMTPLQIKQQKFSKMSAIMQPEIQAVQKKYQGKRDQESMQRMNEETQMIYQKYGVSPAGSCIQLAIQFPVLMALWQVIYRIPAYVGSVKNIFTALVTDIIGVNGYTEIVKTFISDNKMGRVALVMDEAGAATSNSIVDFLYALSPAQWTKLGEIKELGYKIKLDTNGSRPEILKLAVEQGLVDYVAMDIKNSKEKYAKTIGTDKVDIRDIEESVEFLMNTDLVDYEFRTTIVEEFHETEDIEKISLWLAGAKRLFLQQYVDRDSCIEHGFHPVPKEKALIWKAILDKNIEHVELRGYE